MIHYNNCPICGALHDDGAMYQITKGKYRFICFDCADQLEDLKKRILEHFNAWNKSNEFVWSDETLEAYEHYYDALKEYADALNITLKEATRLLKLRLKEGE